MTVYDIIIAVSLLIIVSFFFNWFSQKTNFPSVLLLIGLGIGLKSYLFHQGVRTQSFNTNEVLEILGNIGLVFIVLEAALDLKLEREKIPILLKSFLTATVSFVATMFALGFFLHYVFPGSAFFNCLIYAIPLSIMSSSIIIPSVGSLTGKKKEFMVLESTFSDIIGIMVFYFMMEAYGVSADKVAYNVATNIVATIVLSVVASFVLVFIVQRLTMQVKLFLILAVLLLLFAVGKSFHLSSLLLIMVFGLFMNNAETLFGGKLSRFFRHETITAILHDFHTLTLESAFLLRTFFFVIFGYSITLSGLYSWQNAVYGLIITALLYLVRFICLAAFARKHLYPEVLIAPRGLITILLFFSIEKSQGIVIAGFDPGILLYPIFITSIVMTIGLLTHRGTKLGDAVKQQLPHLPK